MKKIISVLLLFNLIALSFEFNIYAGKNILTMSEAISFAQKYSQEYKNKDESRAKKKIELSQAIEAVEDIRKNESTERYSSGSKMELPEGHGMKDEIELLMKIPRLEMEVRDITNELESVKFSDQEKTENCFISIYEYDKKAKMSQETLNELNKKLKVLEKKSDIGKATSKEVESLKIQIKKQEEQLSNNLSNLERQKEKLSDLVGFDVTYDYIFKNPLKKFDVDRSYLNEIITYSLNNDFNVTKARNTENIAKRNVDEIYGVYGKKWGAAVRRIEKEVKSNSEGNIEDLLDKYKYLLEDIDSPWAGSYIVDLPFLKLDVPKEALKKEYDGQRYFGDQKYSIIVAIKEREDAKRDVKLKEKELTENIKDGFESLKSSWKIYDSSVDTMKHAKKEYDRVVLQNKIGKASNEEVDNERSNFISAKDTVFDNLISYNKQLSNYNKITNGAVSSLMEDVTLFLSSAKSGEPALEYEEIWSNDENAITYYINNVVDQTKAVFGIQVLRGYPNKITHYEVLTPEKTVIGDKVKVDETVSALPVEYKGSTEFLVRLYNEDEFVDEGTFDPIVFSGKLNLKLENNQDSIKEENKETITQEKNTIGLYNISNVVGSLVKKLNFDISAVKGISFYKIVDDKGKEIGKKDKFYSVNEDFKYAGFIFNDLSKLKVNLYDSSYNLKFVAEFDQVKGEIIANNK